MNVLFLDQFSDLGGAQRMLLDLLSAMHDRGWRRAVGLPGAGPLADRAHALGADVFTIPCGVYSSGRKTAADLLRFQAETPRLAVRIRELVDRFAPDLVYINGPRLLPAAALAGLRRPVLFHAHIGVSQRAARLVAGVPLRFLKASVVAVCRDVARTWASFVTTERLTVIYNGVPEPPPGTPRKHAAPPQLGCIGRISPEKGQREFLAAACRIRGAVPESRFVIAGAALFSDTAALGYEREIRKAAANMPVEFTGWVDDIYRVMQRLDLLLVPSVWSEPNPRVILEAFAAGVPVIAFRRGGIPEIVEDGRTGILCDTPAEMAQRAIDLLQGDPERLCALAGAARASWQARFRLDAWQQRMITEMERCAS
ncbi:MAG TPA: glycosyltransferase family 4 protein [Bryobacteraceae bacterium]|nr:glycosyltransferase family 4 protein [Bryobacteraceae bacterium]